MLDNKENDVILALDFGTTNTLAAICFKNGRIRQVKLDPNSSNPYILKSLIHCDEDLKWSYGQRALNLQLDNLENARFFKSIKKFLPHSSLIRTIIGGKKKHS